MLSTGPTICFSLMHSKKFDLDLFDSESQNAASNLGTVEALENVRKPKSSVTTMHMHVMNQDNNMSRLV